MATGAPPSKTHLATFGRSQLTMKICHSAKSANAPRPHRDAKSLKAKLMPAKAKPIPEGECAATPNLSVSNATEMIDFYKKVFGAVETM